MHYGIVAIGSRGDVQPYLALGLGLRQRGHRVTIMAHENFRDFVEEYGIGFHPLYGSVEGLLKTEDGMAMLRSGSILAFARYLKKVIKATQGNVNRDMLLGAEKTDVLVSSLLAIPWIDSIAEKLRKPWAIVQLNLPATRTAEFPLAALDYFNFGLYNRLTYRLLEIFHWRNNKKPVNHFRRTLDMRPLRSPVLRRIVEEEILNFYCFSPQLCARPSDWPANTGITGFLFIPEEDRGRNLQEARSGDLLRWMAEGEPPVYIGFGSIPIPDAVLFLSIMQSLLERTAYRFIFCQGWSAKMNLPSHPRFYHVDSVNHAWLFPQCLAAVIHGGVGTTAAALKAGIPVIIVSIIADQPWWGKIIAEKGVGIHIPFKRLTEGKLSVAIAATQTQEMKKLAKGLGEQIAAEDGLGKTITGLEAYFGPKL